MPIRLPRLFTQCIPVGHRGRPPAQASAPPPPPPSAPREQGPLAARGGQSSTHAQRRPRNGQALATAARTGGTEPEAGAAGKAAPAPVRKKTMLVELLGRTVEEMHAPYREEPASASGAHAAPVPETPDPASPQGTAEAPLVPEGTPDTLPPEPMGLQEPPELPEEPVSPQAVAPGTADSPLTVDDAAMPVPPSAQAEETPWTQARIAMSLGDGAAVRAPRHAARENTLPTIPELPQEDGTASSEIQPADASPARAAPAAKAAPVVPAAGPGDGAAVARGKPAKVAAPNRPWHGGVTARPWSVSAGLGPTSIARVGDGPLRHGAPTLPTARREESLSLPEFSRKAMRTVSGVVERMGRPEFPIEERPGQGRLGRKMAKLVPFLHPKPLAGLKTIESAAPGRAAAGRKARVAVDPGGSETRVGLPLIEAAGRLLKTETDADAQDFALKEIERHAADLSGRVAQVGREFGEDAQDAVALQQALRGQQRALLLARGRLPEEERPAMLQQGKRLVDAIAHLDAAAKAQRAVGEALTEAHRIVAVAQEARESARGQWEQSERAALDGIYRQPPGFEDTPASQALGERLRGAIAALPERGKDALPASIAAEQWSRALSMATQGDPGRAAVVLDRLQERPLLDWVELEAGRPEAEAGGVAQADVRALFRLVGEEPRGPELLHLLASNRADPLDSATAQAMRTYWRADIARQAETQEPVRQWLDGAHRIAAHAAHGRPLDGFPDVEVAAYNAVRNGYTSNAPGTPYAKHNERMLKLTHEWIDRIDRTQRTLAETLLPSRGKTPFSPENIALATSQAEAFGIPTLRTQADMLVKLSAGRLQEIAEAGLMQALVDGGAEEQARARLFDVSLQELARHIAERDKGNVSSARLDRKDFDAIRAAVAQVLDEEPAAAARGKGWSSKLRKTLHKPSESRHQQLPELFEEMAKKGATPAEALRAGVQLLLSPSGPEMPEALSQELLDALGLEAMESKIAASRNRVLEQPEDLADFLQPMIEGFQLRQRIRLAGGGVEGLGLPLLPYSTPLRKLFLDVQANLSRRDEAYVQLFMPLIGMELSFGSAETRAADARLNIGPRWQVKNWFSVVLGSRVRASGQKQASEATLMRFLRKRHEEDVMKAQMAEAVNSIARLDRIAPNKGPAYSGPMEAVLARCPAVSISELAAGSRALSADARVAGIATLGKDLGGDGGITLGGGGNLGFTATAERTRNWTDERFGHTTVAGDKGSTARQTVVANATVSARVPAFRASQPLAVERTVDAEGNEAVRARGGSVGGASNSGFIDASRELYWQMQRHGLSPFTINGKQDADIDRHYASPTEMLAEVQLNRERWLARCVETLEPDEQGVKDTPANRAHAAAIMEDFEEELKYLGEHSPISQYNINDSMRGQAAAWIDGLALGRSLARRREDGAAYADEATRQIDAVLQGPATFRQLTHIVRERSRQTADRFGLNYGIRRQGVNAVDVQRTATQYPRA
ncbi:hypothetical protein ACAN107058_12295 [Paracidovorax anthurii]|uniref:Uncharacterized protein n=2 Tax=Paracidovorax anthurii TaxID=78229 RepID=A0A328YU03_9BURK|nr:hypothetical protein AX018_103814 [Paracidovorax anthurii]